MNLAHLFILVILSGSIVGCGSIDSPAKGCPEKTFGKLCHRCNCKTDCNQENGTCGSKCLEGWHGPNCQMQNIARNKQTKVRVYDNSIGQSTVNGDRTDCSFLVQHDSEVMRLQVELEETDNINGITIFTSKNDTNLKKMEGFDVLLSTSSIRKGNVCYDNTQNGKISDLGKIDTSCHGKAKNVFIRHKKRPSYLNICEIEVYVCQTGFWGEQCESPCECTDTKDQTCDSKTGKCLGGCSMDGYCPQVAGMDNSDDDGNKLTDPDKPVDRAESSVTLEPDSTKSLSTTDLVTTNSFSTDSLTSESTPGSGTTDSSTANSIATESDMADPTDSTTSGSTTATTVGNMTTTTNITTTVKVDNTTLAPSTTTTMESTTPFVSITTENGGTTNTTSIQSTTLSSMASKMTTKLDKLTPTSDQSTSTITNTQSTTMSSGPSTTTVEQTTLPSLEVNTGEIKTTTAGNQMTTTTQSLQLSTSDMNSVTNSSMSTETVPSQGSSTGSDSSLLSSGTTSVSTAVSSSESVTSVKTTGGPTPSTLTSEQSTSTSTVDSTQTMSSSYISSTDLSNTNGTTMPDTNGTETTTSMISSTTVQLNETSETTINIESSTSAPASSTVDTSFESTSEMVSGSTMESSTSSPESSEMSTTPVEATETGSTTEGPVSTTMISETATQANVTSESTVTSSVTETSDQSSSVETTEMTETTETTQSVTETTSSQTEAPSTESTSPISMEPTTMGNTTSEAATQSTEGLEGSTPQPTEITSESVTVSAQTSESTFSQESTMEMKSTTIEASTAQPTESSSESSSEGTSTTIQTVESTTVEAQTTQLPENITVETSTQTAESTTIQQSTPKTTVITTTGQSTRQTTLSTLTITNQTQSPIVPSPSTPVSTTTMLTTGPTVEPTGTAGALAAIVVPSVLLVIIIVGIIFAGIIVFKRRNRNKMQDEEIAGNDIIMIPLTPVKPLVTNGVKNRDKLDDSLPYAYDEDGDLVYTGNAPEQPIPVKDLQSHNIKLQENGQFSTDYQSLPDGMILPTKDSKLDENMAKNRYTNMLAYDHSRVKLRGLPAGQSDYINANYIDGFKKKKAYIATQGPLKPTTPDFWTMVWQEEVKKIVMVTNLKEKNRVKCYQYWPNEKKAITCRNLRVSTDAENVFPVFVLRKIKVTDTKTDESRMVTQYHFTAWPDHGVPDAFQLLQFFRKVTDNGTEYDVAPTVVHCSAGVGRTGTYIGLDALWKEGFKTGYVDILSFARKMRKNRTKMIQTLDQYIFLHFILMEAFANPDAAVPESMIAKLKGPKDPRIIQRINAEFEKLNALRPEYQVTDHQDALHPSNQSKNRSQDNLPVDKYRARLSTLYGDDEDYINAVILPSSWNQEGILMTQYPLPNTIADFWTMVYSYKSPTIVLLDDSTDFEECFFPSLEQTSEWGRLVIQTTAVSEPQDCVKETTITLTNTVVENEDEMEVKIFTGHGWNPSSELPDQQKLLHCLHYEVQKRQTKLGEQRPVVVMCRDGVKKSGLYCAICNMLEGIDWYREVNVYHSVRQLQLRKPEAIKSKIQYQYCYQVALNYLDSGNVYENQGSNEEEEERESEYANIGTARSSLKMDPLKEPGVKGQGKSVGQGHDGLYANFGKSATSSDSKKTSNKKEMMTSI
ncbi:uncharacterized protein LOC111119360 isoform X3 [Crassostrea virginica]